MAKALFLLTDTQLAALPHLELTGDEAKRTGCSMGGKISLFTSGSCLAAAVERWGSIGGLTAEAASRLAKAVSKGEVKRQQAKDEAAEKKKYEEPADDAEAGVSPGLAAPAASHEAASFAPKGVCNFAHLNQMSGRFNKPCFGMLCAPSPTFGGHGYGAYEDEEDKAVFAG